MTSKDTPFPIQVTSIDGETFSLEKFRGKVLLIVNVASKCGFTPQYQGLEKLYQELKPQGFEVLGFPCNQFGAQEPGNEEEIKKFCSLSYDVTFPLFSKVDVNGEHTHPLYRFLKSAEKGIFGTEAIKWNFTKFLVGRDGTVLSRYAPITDPASLRGDIGKALESSL